MKIKKTAELIEKLNIDANEKEAILYILDVLSGNMLDEKDKNKFMEVRKMMINPRDEYLVNKGIEKGIEKGKEIGIEKGIEKEKFEIAKKLLPKMSATKHFILNSQFLR